MAGFQSQHGDLDCHQNLITCSIYHTGPLHKISLQSVCIILSNAVNRQTDRLNDRHTNKQTNTTENMISFWEIIK